MMFRMRIMDKRLISNQSSMLPPPEEVFVVCTDAITVTLTLSELAMPKSSVMVSENAKVPAVLGAVKLACGLSA